MVRRIAFPRYGMAALIGVLVATVIFLLMYLVVATGERAIIEKVAIYKLETDLREARDARLPFNRLPPRPVEPGAPSEAESIAVPRIKTTKPGPVGSAVMGSVDRDLGTSVAAGTGLDTGLGAGLGLAVEGDYLPIVRVRPRYPRRAIEQGIEGFVVVELTVTPSGATEGARVIASEPGTLFDQAALAAVRQFRYKPKVLNGVPVPVSGVRYKFTFTITNAGGRE